MKKTALGWLLKNIKKRIPALLVLTAANIGNALFGVWFALGTRQVIDAAVSGGRERFWQACLLQGSIILGLILTQWLSRHLHAKLEAELDRDWKKSILHTLLRGDYASVSAYHSGELLNRLNNDVRAVNEGVLNILPNCAAMIARIVGALGAMLALEPVFTGILVAAGAILLVVTGFARRKLKAVHREVSEAEGRVSSIIQETLEKLLLVQAMDLGSEMERRTHTRLDARFKAQRKRKNIGLFANTSISVLYYMAGFGALAWCSVGLLNNTMSFGDLTAVTQLVNQVQAPFVNLSGILPQYAAMLGSAERLMELEHVSDHSAEEKILPRETYESVDAICARGLSFGYDREEILSELSFRLEKGCFAVVTGPSGRGKSTLLKLMLGIFHPDDGKLYLDRGGEEIPLTRSTRQLFAYVPQGNLIFSGTIRENLMIVAPNATEEAIRQATFVSAMDDYLPQLPQGLETVLGESGAGLSEGQSQRLAIARAVLGGAPIVLLDEATSALDEETEKKVLERLRQLPGRTCIAVTHRPTAKDMANAQLDLT